MLSGILAGNMKNLLCPPGCGYPAKPCLCWAAKVLPGILLYSSLIGAGHISSGANMAVPGAPTCALIEVLIARA